MSQKSVDFITEVLPEPSKGHARIMLLSQIEKLASDAADPTFCRAKWVKKSKKVVVCSSKHHPRRTLKNLTKSPTFDPDSSANFIYEEMSKADMKAESLIHKVGLLYSKNVPMQDIAKELDFHYVARASTMGYYRSPRANTACTPLLRVAATCSSLSQHA